MMRWTSLAIVACALALPLLASSAAHAQQPQKPNIVIIWGDDIGQSNISAYSHGMMGYKTPNIDRIAKEGVMFTDYYAEQSCTAGRSSFITGQSGLRTGLTKVGLPGATLGLQKEDPTIAELLKPLGYATGQFGKNHLGDRNEFLPTVHGFDEFYGNLYHLNAEEEPEHAGLSERSRVPREVRPARRDGLQGLGQGRPNSRSALRQGRQAGVQGHRPADQGADGGIDDDIANRAVDFIQRQKNANKPFFVWVNYDPHALPHPHQAGERRPVWALAEPVPRHHDRPRQECRHGPEGAR